MPMINKELWPINYEGAMSWLREQTMAIREQPLSVMNRLIVFNTSSPFSTVSFAIGTWFVTMTSFNDFDFTFLEEGFCARDIVEQKINESTSSVSFLQHIFVFI